MLGWKCRRCRRQSTDREAYKAWALGLPGCQKLSLDHFVCGTQQQNRRRAGGQRRNSQSYCLAAEPTPLNRNVRKASVRAREVSRQKCNLHNSRKKNNLNSADLKIILAGRCTRSAPT